MNEKLSREGKFLRVSELYIQGAAELADHVIIM